MEKQKSVSKMSFEKIFANRVQYEIPFFQRGYSWEKINWQQLLDDIKENILEEYEDLEDLEDVEFFFGSIVIAERTTNSLPNENRHFLIIDGQQRLTTVYIALAIIYNLLKNKCDNGSPGLTKEIAELQKLLINDSDSDDDYDKIKILSCKGDKLPTYQTVFDTDEKPCSKTLREDYYAYNEKHNNLNELVKFLRKEFQRKNIDELLIWEKILRRSLKVVWIPIDEQKDDVQSIFETLNDRGRPLTSSELICNYLFKTLREEEDFNEIHNEKWLRTINHINKKGNMEDYLRTIFSIGESVAIGSGRNVYVHIKKKYKNITKDIASKLLDQIAEDVHFYNYIINPQESSPHHKYRESDIHSLLVDISDTRMESSRYYIIEILKALDKEVISSHETIALLKELLTALVRRKVSGLPTNMYNRVFPSLFSKLQGCENKVSEFIAQMVTTRIYITDEQFKHSLINNNLYTSSTDLPFTRMILKTIDKSQEPHSQHADFTKFNTVEHIMPQKLTRDWEDYIAEDANNPMLKLYINSIGNLCLLNDKANSHAQQRLFPEKIKDYPNASSLTRDLKEYKGIWNIQAINNRSKHLAEIANKIWAWSKNMDKSFKPVEYKSGEIFYLIDGKKEADARGSFFEETREFVVYKDSVCNTKVSQKDSPTVQNIAKRRKELEHRGIIGKSSDGSLVFLKDHHFSSPSAAAQIVRGGSSNGWEYWKTREGEPLNNRYPNAKEKK